MNMMLVHILSAFFVGGIVVTLISLLAERVHERIAGIIMMFPSTIVIGFFFVGLSTSAQHLAEVVPATLIPIGMISFLAVVYIAFSQFFASRVSSKIGQILLTLVAASATWLILATPFAIYKFNNTAIGLAGYLAFMILAHYLINRQANEERMPRIVYTRLQLMFRGSFVGSIVAIVVFLGKTLGPFWGGVFTMYPAATFASLMIFHFHYNPSQLVFFMKKAPLGSLSILIYALSAMFLFPVFGLISGTIFSYLICFLFSIMLIMYQQKTVWKFSPKRND